VRFARATRRNIPEDGILPETFLLAYFPHFDIMKEAYYLSICLYLCVRPTLFTLMQLMKPPCNLYVFLLPIFLWEACEVSLLIVCLIRPYISCFMCLHISNKIRQLISLRTSCIGRALSRFSKVGFTCTQFWIFEHWHPGFQSHHVINFIYMFLYGVVHRNFLTNHSSTD
jgi:hypothetical protein